MEKIPFSNQLLSDYGFKKRSKSRIWEHKNGFLVNKNFSQISLINRMKSVNITLDSEGEFIDLCLKFGIK